MQRGKCSAISTLDSHESFAALLGVLCLIWCLLSTIPSCSAAELRARGLRSLSHGGSHLSKHAAVSFAQIAGVGYPCLIPAYLA